MQTVEPSEATHVFRAAQYVRMSTEHQQYSTENQGDKILEYAAQRGIQIVRTFADQGKSGLRIDGRQALQELIRTVESGQADFEIILVYDVSRWGRFQDADESAYYEYICRRAGIQVAYCAEQFENDGSPVSTIVKGVKRAMAGEYSRELSAKVFAGQCRLIELGFRQGGPAGYGLRRVLIDQSGAVKVQLARGEHKSLQTDRVILMPGPEEEVATVNRVYRWFVDEGAPESVIAERLNKQRILTDLGREWTRATVREVLTNEKYIGNNIYNRQSFKLKKVRVVNQPEMWIRKDRAFEGIVPSELFFTAQGIMRARAQRYTDEELIAKLRELYARHGYPHLDARIRSTYAERSSATNKNSLYDSYIRAIRWASDRIGQAGIIGFVTNAGFLEAATADGLRKCLAEEFSSIYVFHLRGNQRTAGELSRKEGGKIFGGGSRAPIAISVLIKNPNAALHGEIYFHDVGDYLNREEKLDKISSYGSTAGISEASGWRTILPDTHGDWLRQRDGSFDEFIALGDKKSGGLKLFNVYSNGVKTQRDAWCYNPSKKSALANMTRMIAFYNAEAQRFSRTFGEISKKNRDEKVDDFIDTDPTQISWTRALKQDLVRGRRFEFEPQCLTPSLYRPFTKQWLYFNRRFNEMVYLMPRIFPDATVENRAIMVKQRWPGDGQLALMVNCPPELQIDGGAQSFPLYFFDDTDAGAEEIADQAGLFTTDPATQVKRKRRDALTDEGLAHFRAAYPGETINKEDVFYYVYGILHSPDYRELYTDNLGKELPRIPCVKLAGDFWAFSRAGRALAELHLNYESVPMYADAKIEHTSKSLNDVDYRVEKMRIGKNGNDKDLTTVIYNSHITVTGIPPEAYEYVVNGKSAIDWVIERQCVKVEKASGIVSDANEWATETMKNPRYPLELLLRVVTVSMETTKIVNALPKLVLE